MAAGSSNWKVCSKPCSKPGKFAAVGSLAGSCFESPSDPSDRSADSADLVGASADAAAFEAALAVPASVGFVEPGRHATGRRCAGSGHSQWKIVKVLKSHSSPAEDASAAPGAKLATSLFLPPFSLLQRPQTPQLSTQLAVAAPHGSASEFALVPLSYAALPCVPPHASSIPSCPLHVFWLRFPRVSSFLPRLSVSHPFGVPH